MRKARSNNTVDNVGRRMMSRRKKNQVKVLSNLVPGTHTAHWLGCCSAPTCCPMCSLCPCCTESEYIVLKREASKYIFIRENSIEWNEPEVVMRQGSCMGIDPCVYDIHDRVNVLYFDDPMFSRVTDQTRWCNECRSYCCGGRGERVQIDSPCCFNLCHRSSQPCPVVPICCPQTLFPCMLKYEIYLEDAQRAVYEIEQARQAALKNPLYCDPGDLEKTDRHSPVQVGENTGHRGGDDDDDDDEKEAERRALDSASLEECKHSGGGVEMSEVTLHM